MEYIIVKHFLVLAKEDFLLITVDALQNDELVQIHSNQKVLHPSHNLFSPQIHLSEISNHKASSIICLKRSPVHPAPHHINSHYSNLVTILAVTHSTT